MNIIKKLKLIWMVITKYNQASFLLSIGTTVLDDAVAKYEEGNFSPVEVKIRINWREVAARKGQSK